MSPTWRKISHKQQGPFSGNSSIICGALRRSRLSPIKLAYDSRQLDVGSVNSQRLDWVSIFASSSDNRAYCYAELAVSSLPVASTYCAICLIKYTAFNVFICWRRVYKFSSLLLLTDWGIAKLSWSIGGWLNTKTHEPPVSVLICSL